MSLTPTKARDRSRKLAAADPTQALAIARAIKDPWFRCQALSQVARYWPGMDYFRLLDEAVQAAESLGEAYKRVTVSAWPIRAYLERDNSSVARSLLERSRRSAGQIENLGSRSEALLMLLQSARPFATELWEPIFWALLDSSEPSLAWRQSRNLGLAIQMVAADHPELVQAAILRLKHEKTLAALRRDAENRRFAQPRPFFWID